MRKLLTVILMGVCVLSVTQVKAKESKVARKPSQVIGNIGNAAPGDCKLAIDKLKTSTSDANFADNQTMAAALVASEVDSAYAKQVYDIASAKIDAGGKAALASEAFAEAQKICPQTSDCGLGLSSLFNAANIQRDAAIAEVAKKLVKDVNDKALVSATRNGANRLKNKANKSIDKALDKAYVACEIQ